MSALTFHIQAQDNQTEETANDSSRDETITALAAMKAEGIDPAPYFALVANSLIARFGVRALAMADKGEARMKTLGDSEGAELWREVRAVIKAELGVPGDALSLH